MPNYSLKVDSNFTPTDYSAALIPIFSDYGTRWNTKYEKAQQDYLDRLEIQALIEAEKNIDQELWDIYSNYDTQYKDYLEAFNKGIDSNLIERGLDLNRLYKTSIDPINKQFKYRSEKINEQNLLRQQDDTLQFDVDFRDVRISDLLDNPDMSYTSYSGKNIRDKVALGVQSLGNAYYRILNNPNSAEDNTTDQYLLAKSRQGYSLNELIDVINNDNSAPEELKTLIQTIKNEYGYDDLNTNLKNHIDNYINEGVLLGVGKVEQDWMSNRNYQSQMDIWQKERQELQDELESQKVLNKQLEAQNKATEKGWDIKKIPGDDINNPLYVATRGGRTITGRNLDEVLTGVAQEGVQLTPSEKIKSGNIVAGVIVDKNNTENPVIGLEMQGDKKIRSQNYDYNNWSNGFNSQLIENRRGRKDIIKTKDNLELQNAFEVSDFGTQEIMDAIFTAFTTNPNIFNQLSNNEIINSITEEYYQDIINNSEEIKNLYVELENLEKQIENSKDRDDIENLTNQYNIIIGNINKKQKDYYNTVSENIDTEINSYLSNPTYYNDPEVKKVIINYIIHAIKGGQLSLIGVPGTDRRQSQNDYILIQNRK